MQKLPFIFTHNKQSALYVSPVFLVPQGALHLQVSEKYEIFSQPAGHPKLNYSYFVFKISLTVGSTVHGWDSPEKWLGLLLSPLSSLPYPHFLMTVSLVTLFFPW